MTDLYKNEPWAALVREIGLEPEETEAQARHVAKYAAKEIGKLRKRMHSAEDDASRLRYPDTTGQ